MRVDPAVRPGFRRTAGQSGPVGDNVEHRVEDVDDVFVALDVQDGEGAAGVGRVGVQQVHHVLLK